MEALSESTKNEDVHVPILLAPGGRAAGWPGGEVPGAERRRQKKQIGPISQVRRAGQIRLDRNAQKMTKISASTMRSSSACAELDSMPKRAGFPARSIFF